VTQSSIERSRVREAFARWRDALPVVRADLGLMVGCALLVAFGVMLRSNDLPFPSAMTFDENHFVVNARHYLAGTPDTNDHPPLGKLLIASAIYLFRDSSRFWRLAPFIAGLLSIAIVYRLASRLFSDHRAGWIAAALLAVDGFYIAYGRTALLDGMLAMFMLAAALFIADATRKRDVFAACVFIGLASSIKFTGIVLIPALVLAIALRHRTLRWSVLALPIIPAVYFAQFSLGLYLTGRPAGPLAVIEATRALVAHHQALTAMTNPHTSTWFTWLVLLRPILLRFDVVEGGVRAMTMLGNPLLWLSVNVSLLLLLVRLPQRFVASLAARWSVAGPRRMGRWLGAARPWAWLALFWLLPVVPWMVSRRDSYIYHYLPSYGFGLVLVAGMVLAAYRRAPLLTLAALSVVGIVAAFYAPVWAQLPLTQQAYELRLPFEAWR